MGALTIDVVEGKLVEVKALCEDASGRDVDAEPGADSELQYDADGAAWVRTVGAGALTVGVLEDKLAELKALYSEIYGHDAGEDPIGAETESEDGEPGSLCCQGPLALSVLLNAVQTEAPHRSLPPRAMEGAAPREAALPESHGVVLPRAPQGGVDLAAPQEPALEAHAHHGAVHQPHEPDHELGAKGAGQVAA